MSLRDPAKKMSKSDPIAAGRISLLDTDDEIALKIQKAKTDSIHGITYDRAARPELANLIEIYAALANRSVASLTFLDLASSSSLQSAHGSGGAASQSRHGAI